MKKVALTIACIGAFFVTGCALTPIDYNIEKELSVIPISKSPKFFIRNVVLSDNGYFNVRDTELGGSTEFSKALLSGLESFNLRGNAANDRARIIASIESFEMSPSVGWVLTVNYEVQNLTSRETVFSVKCISKNTIKDNNHNVLRDEVVRQNISTFIKEYSSFVSGDISILPANNVEQEYSKITIFRPSLWSALFHGIDIVDSSDIENPKIIGRLSNGTKLTYSVKPGQYTLMSSGKCPSVLKIDASKGENYAVELRPVPCGQIVQFVLRPISRKDFSTSSVRQYFDTLPEAKAIDLTDQKERAIAIINSDNMDCKSVIEINPSNPYSYGDK